MSKPRLLIEEWLPCQAIGVECMRERSTGQQPPDKRLHVWWARRPLTVIVDPIVNTTSWRI
jgi:putative DNA methylase